MFAIVSVTMTCDAESSYLVYFLFAELNYDFIPDYEWDIDGE
jgi:hypothetical protein